MRMTYAGFTVILVLLVIGTESQIHAALRVFHVDAVIGDDQRDGLSPQTAWRSLAKVNEAEQRPGDSVLFKRGQSWRGQLRPHSGSADGIITYGAFGEGPKPMLLGSVAKNRAEDWKAVGEGLWATGTFDVDVGNIIFDEGQSTGVKKWGEKELREDGDYFYDPNSKQVMLRSAGNPATRHRSIELALRRHIIDQGARSYVRYEGLSLKYGSAHGIGGGNTHHITVRDCDLAYIGGGHQLTRPDGKPVRFGNGVEFWSSARECLVEDCRLWEIYDAALTNQGDGTNVQENITYRRNVIWNCEYSFEYWNRGPASRTRNIRFEYNTCVDAGFGWGHRQRPDPNGRHLMFYDNSAATEDVIIRHNVFSRATDSCLRLHGKDWTAALRMDRNCWYQPEGPMAQWGNEQVESERFPEFQRRRGMDGQSIVADPGFVDPGRRDYRLAAGSPARGIIESRLRLVIEPGRQSIGDGDNWPITWADDGDLYTFYCDGKGFGGGSGQGSMSPAKVKGAPPDIVGENIESQSGHKTGSDVQGRKASGLLMVDGVLYMWVRNLNKDGTGSSLAWSKDRGKTWTWAEWNWPEAGYPVWMNAGRNYGAAQDGFAYVYWPDTPSAYKTADQMLLARVPVDGIIEKDKYEFFAGLDENGKARWSSRFEDRKAAFTDRGHCYRPEVVYVPGLKRYLLCTATSGSPRWCGTDEKYLGIFDGPTPWGPWSEITRIQDWGGRENRFQPRIPSKWISEDGRSFYLLYSCFPEGPYKFNVERCRLEESLQ